MRVGINRTLDRKFKQKLKIWLDDSREAPGEDKIRGKQVRQHCTFAFPEGDLKASHPKEVQRVQGAIISVPRKKVNCRGRESAQRDTRQ